MECFVRNLYKLAEYCEFGINKYEHISDRIAIGIMYKAFHKSYSWKWI